MSEQPQQSSPVVDPNGPPRVLDYAKHAAAQGFSMGAVILAGGAAVLLVLAAVPTRTMGALRSQRIKWQERRQEIAAGKAECDSANIRAADTAGEQPHD